MNTLIAAVIAVLVFLVIFWLVGILGFVPATILLVLKILVGLVLAFWVWYTVMILRL